MTCPDPITNLDTKLIGLDSGFEILTRYIFEQVLGHISH